MSNICSIPDCGKPRKKRDWCEAHYSRWLRHGDPLAGRSTPQGELLRFYREVVLQYEGEDCLIWPYGRKSDGYGQMRYDGKMATVSRLVCIAEHGHPPLPKLEAAHSCGKGHLGCVARNHLSWKTPTENWADRYKHGTDNSGSRNGRWKHGLFVRAAQPTQEAPSP